MGTEIDKFVRSRRRTIALIVERDGSLTVRAPMRAPLAEIESFVHDHQEWIERTRERMRLTPVVPEKQFMDGEKFHFLGREYELRIVHSQRPALKFNGGFSLSRGAQRRGRAVFERWYKSQAARILTERVERLANQGGYEPRQVRITSARTRWGSCSPDGTLNFSWRLVQAPLEVIDYVALHELANLRIRSHSRRFWKLVEQHCPDFRLRRKWLREFGDKFGM